MFLVQYLSRAVTFCRGTRAFYEAYFCFRGNGKKTIFVNNLILNTDMSLKLPLRFYSCMNLKKLSQIVLVLFLFLFSLNLSAQSGLTILCVAAHPDDEDGATLAYYSKLKGYNAYTVFYTRGEGGQNEIGPELYDELGKIREQECKDAAKIQGSTPLFLGEVDFGFSKTAKETFKMWGGEDSVLARIVYFIRQLKPDVVITNHDTITTKPNRQHGNHQAVGITIFEAFDKAADPNYHPEQLHNGISTWQIKKLYFRVFDTTKTDRIFTINTMETDPVSGKTIEDISWDALAKHRTQGMDKIDRNNIPLVFRQKRYELVRADNMYPIEGSDLFTGIEPTDKNVNPVFLDYPTIYYYPPVNNVKPEDFQFDKNTKIGLVKTYDISIENFFNKFGINYTLIDSAKLSGNLLSGYDVILLDLRAYLYRKDVLFYNDRLMDYVNSGGNIITFYNKPSDWNLGRDLAPYPLYVTSERVTEEDAPVTILKPDHKYFNLPNAMNSADWTGWIQERNIYLPSDDTMKTSSKYDRLLSMQDENDPVPSTSLLYTNYGKGTYTYCALALYRQLKILNPGAIKLFLNMISQKSTIRQP